MMGANTTVVFNQPPSLTQPGHPSGKMGIGKSSRVNGLVSYISCCICGLVNMLLRATENGDQCCLVDSFSLGKDLSKLHIIL